MSAWRLILRELQFRRTNFCLGVLAMLVATGCVVAAISLVDRYNQRSRLRAEDEQAELAQRMAALEDDYRKISLGLGFNVMILPKDQNLADFYADDFAAKLMPESLRAAACRRPTGHDQSHRADPAAADFSGPNGSGRSNSSARAAKWP